MQENKPKPKNGIAAITLNLGIASMLAGLVIGGVYYLTEGRILANRKAMEEESMRSLVPQAQVFEPVAGRPGSFSALQDGQAVADIVAASGHGYGGAIKMVAAVSAEGKLLGFEIVSHNETPGLGDRATEPAFRRQFVGRKAGDFEVTKTHEAGKIDALSGATITSRAVAKALDAALGELAASKGGVQ